ncbi:MAG: PVC-type heme-binding CxxCH protein [Bacteroidota bacterium]
MTHRFFLLLTIFLWACSAPSSDDHGFAERSSSLATASPADFDEGDIDNMQLAEDFQISLWAPEPLLKNAVAISFDEMGAAYVSQTQRRKSSDLDIRQHRDWMIDDLRLASLQDTRDFHLEQLATDRSEINIWLKDHNGDGIRDYRDLCVQSETIRKIWDGDGDGRADTSIIYAEDFNDMLSGVAAGVMHQNGDVYLTVAPDVYRLRDEDGDDQAEQRQVISHGYGIHIGYAGHDMSGLTIGPDGKVYWSIGDIGIDVYDSLSGQHWSYPHEGGVMRCNPDGSEFEVFAHGLRNPQELAFDAYGNLISVDNDGDHPGEHERYVHIIEGSDSGWRTYWQYGKYEQENEAYKPWMDEQLHVPHFDGQAAYLLPPIALAADGPAGLVYNPGTALGTNWRNHFFASFFTGSSANSKIQAFQIEPKGASFRISKQEQILQGVVATGLAFGPDGALYLNDWFNGYALKEEGRIWKIDTKEADPARLLTQAGLRTDLSTQSNADLLSMMHSPDQRLRLKAQFALVQREAKDDLLNLLTEDTATIPRLHAIWGLGQLLRKQPGIGFDLGGFLHDKDPHVRAQTAKIHGEGKFGGALRSLTNCLSDTNAQVQFYAAEALGKLGNQAAVEPLKRLLTKTGEDDPHLRHAITLALSRVTKEETLASWSQDPNPHTRIGAVLALRYQRSAKLASFLSDPNEQVAIEAARAIHDDLSVPAAMNALASSLSNPTTLHEAYLRRAINANLRLGTQACAQRLVEFATSEQMTLTMRQDALWALGYWESPPVLDRVEGRYRILPKRSLAEAQEAFATIAEDWLYDSEPALQNACIQAIGRLKYQSLASEILEIVDNKNRPLAQRRSALKSLYQLESPQISLALKSAISSAKPELREDAQAYLTEVDMEPEAIIAMLGTALELGSIGEQQQAFASLAKMQKKEAETLILQWFKRLKADQVAPELKLDILLAAESSQGQALREALTQYKQSKGDSPSDAYLETIYGGTVRKGARLFYLNNSAQCIRCHVFRGKGGAVGPDLTAIAQELDHRQLLEALIEPSKRLAPGYGNARLSLQSGEVITGVIVEDSENETILKVGEAEPQTFRSDQIKEKTYLPSSMPSMAGVLSKREIRDLMAFLRAAQ